jgi:hypothetical protein
MSEREQIIQYLQRERDMLLEESHQFMDQGRIDRARVYDKIAAHLTLLIDGIQHKRDQLCMTI